MGVETQLNGVGSDWHFNKVLLRDRLGAESDVDEKSDRDPCLCASARWETLQALCLRWYELCRRLILSAPGTMGKPDTVISFPIHNLVGKLGLDDSRRIVHSLKVGLALTLASLLVLLKRPYEWIGENGIWAVITVVVVFETSAGTTFAKGLNRGLGTVLAGLLALGAAHLADLLPSTAEPISIGAMVFITGSVCTFIRAAPKVKKMYDYGVVIYMLTFCMVLVTGYRTGHEVKMGSIRLLTILIGGVICLAVSSFVFPHWAGRDLHRLTADNFDELGKALEQCVKEYVAGRVQLITSKTVAEDADPIYKSCHKAVKSRNTEEALAVSASWEPPHGRFRLGYPWKQYLTVGTMLRHCAYSVLALHGRIHSEIQAPSGLRIIFAKEMLRASQNAAGLLHELGACIRNMHKPKNSIEDGLKKSSRAAEDIKELISAHSYLLAAPESWAALEKKVHGISGKKTRSTSEKETILSLDKVAKSNCVQAGQAAPDQDCCSEPGLCVHDDIKESSQVKPVHILLSEDYERDAPQPISRNEPNTQTLLCDGVTVNLSDKENRSFSRQCKTASCTVFVNQQSGRRWVEDIAGAASLISFASLLTETLARLDHVVAAVQTLSESGRFTACTCVGPCASVQNSKRLIHLPTSFMQGAVD